MAVPMLRINTSALNARVMNNIDGNNNPRMRNSTRKCLFGAADPAETFRQVEETFRSERQRFFERFGINMEDLENVAVDPQNPKSPKKRRSCPEKQVTKITTEKVSRQMRVLKPYNAQTKMTDFCQIKKSATYVQNKKL